MNRSKNNIFSKEKLRKKSPPPPDKAALRYSMVSINDASPVADEIRGAAKFQFDSVKMPDNEIDNAETFFN